MILNSTKYVTCAWCGDNMYACMLCGLFRERKVLCTAWMSARLVQVSSPLSPEYCSTRYVCVYVYNNSSTALPDSHDRCFSSTVRLKDGLVLKLWCQRREWACGGHTRCTSFLLSYQPPLAPANGRTIVSVDRRHLQRMHDAWVISQPWSSHTHTTLVFTKQVHCMGPSVQHQQRRRAVGKGYSVRFTN